MRFRKTFHLLAGVSALIAAFSASLPCLGQENGDATARAKGIWLEGLKAPHGQGTKPVRSLQTGIQFHVLLLHGDEAKEVPATYSFHDSDRLRFEFELNQDSYVYVLNRTIIGGFDTGAKGIEIASGNTEKPRVSPYRLLFPTDAAGQDNRLKAGQPQTIPPAGNPPFKMDAEPGTEQLFVLMSPTPLDIAKYFDKATAAVPVAGDASGDSARQEDLDREIGRMEANAEVSYAKGIVVDSYGLSRDSGKPSVTKVALNRLPGAASTP